MRSTFIKTLEKYAETDGDLFIVTADVGFNLFDDFKRKFPGRFINVGVAEQNMVGVAAGLALSGKNVYCYSMASFLLRCIEQIKVDVCYQNLNVKLIGAGGGLYYGCEGVTHHSAEDLAVMRSLPNMTVLAPGDPVEVKALTSESIDYPGPVYMRLGGWADPKIHKNSGGIKIGRGVVLSKGADLTIIAAGSILHTAKLVSDELKSKGINSTLVSMHTIKPIDSKLILRWAEKTGALFTIEEHTLMGGLGSAVSEVLAEAGYSGLFRRIALTDAFMPAIGDRHYLRKVASLTPDAIAKSVIFEYKKHKSK